MSADERYGRTTLIVCGAIAKEVRDLAQRRGWQIDLRALPASHHMEPRLILRDVEAQIQKLHNHTRIVVGYGFCGAHGLDELLARYGATRIPGPHCYEMFAGQDFDRMMAEERGTFFLTDFLVKAWRRLVVEWWHLEDRPKLKRILFRHYARVIFLNTQPDPALQQRAQMIADDLGLPLEIRRVGYGNLERRLAALIEGGPWRSDGF